MVGRRLSLESFQLVPSPSAGPFAPLPSPPSGSRGKPLAALQSPSLSLSCPQAFSMDAEEHRLIMQQVKELEVSREMVFPQCAATGMGLLIMVVLGWLQCLLTPRVWVLGYRVAWTVLDCLLA